MKRGWTFKLFGLLTALLVLSACGGGGGGSTTFTIGGTVSGLTGTGLVLQNNAGDDLSITTNGSFTFATALDNEDDYAVTVLTQPNTPNQVCSISNASGKVASANISDVNIVCSTNTYSVGGTVSGLVGTGLTLQNNGGDDLSISANGSFAFATAIADLSTYNVTVSTPPGTPSQTCVVSNGSGTVNGADVTNVDVACTTDTFTISGTVTSLAGSGLVLQNNGGDNLAISANGTFTFATALDDLSNYSVTVSSQPNTPSQLCTVSNGTGTLAGANITNVSVNCVTNTYTVGGTVSGLNGSGLVLQNNGADNLSISANGSFTFPMVLADLSAYSVSVLTQPNTPPQICSVTNGSGNLMGANVTNISINCVNTYTIGGTVSGLAGNGLTLQNNSGDDLSINANGVFTFATALIDGSNFTVSVSNQPTNLSQTCAVSNASGTLSGANVSNVQIACTTNSFTIGGTVTGLTGSGLVLQNNGGDNLSISADGSYTFSSSLLDGSTYAVTIQTQASGQHCDAANRDGTLAGANVTNVTVTCRGWGTAGLVESIDLGDAVEPSVAFDPNGDAMAVWHQHDGTRNNIMYNTYTAGTGWGTEQLLETIDLGNATRANITFDNSGNAMAIWRQHNGTRQTIWARYHNGTSWGTATQIETLNTGFPDQLAKPQIAFDSNGDAIAVWAYFDGAVTYHIRAARFTASSTSWAAPVDLETDLTNQARYPHIAIDANNNAAVVWEQDGLDSLSNPNKSIWANIYTASSNSWGTATLIETHDIGQARSPQVIFDSTGKALVIWEQSDATAQFDILSNVYTPGSGWGATPVNVETQNAGSGFNPKLGIDANDNILTVFYMHNSLNYDVWANTYSSGSWGTEELLESDNTGDARDPQIAVDANGNALALWYQFDGSVYHTWSNRYTATLGWASAEQLETSSGTTSLLIPAFPPAVAIDGLGDGLGLWQQINTSTTFNDIMFNRFE